MYTYADQYVSMLGQAKHRRKVKYDGLTYDNTMGRDNMMYYVSDGFNLAREDDDGSPFGSLMTLNNVKKN